MVRYNILNIISIASNVSITIASSSGVLTPRPPPAVLQHSIQLCGPQSTETRLMLQGLKPIPIKILTPAISWTRHSPKSVMDTFDASNHWMDIFVEIKICCFLFKLLPTSHSNPSRTRSVVQKLMFGSRKKSQFSFLGNLHLHVFILHTCQSTE